MDQKHPKEQRSVREESNKVNYTTWYLICSPLTKILHYGKSRGLSHGVRVEVWNISSGRLDGSDGRPGDVVVTVSRMSSSPGDYSQSVV